jgi:hypothetical protein
MQQLNLTNICATLDLAKKANGGEQILGIRLLLPVGSEILRCALPSLFVASRLA